MISEAEDKVAIRDKMMLSLKINIPLRFNTSLDLSIGISVMHSPNGKFRANVISASYITKFNLFTRSLN